MRMNWTIAWSSSSPPVRMEASQTMPPSAMTAMLVVPPPMSMTMLPTGVSTGRPDADRGRHRLGHHEQALDAGRPRRVADRAPLDFGDAGRDADDDGGLDLEDRAVDDQAEKVPQHLLGDVEVRDDAVLHRPHRQDPVRGAAEHPLGLEADPHDVPGCLIHGGDGRLVQHHAFALDQHQRVGGAEVHGYLRGRTPASTLGHLTPAVGGCVDWELGGGMNGRIDRNGHGTWIPSSAVAENLRGWRFTRSSQWAASRYVRVTSGCFRGNHAGRARWSRARHTRQCKI